MFFSWSGDVGICVVSCVLTTTVSRAKIWPSIYLIPSTPRDLGCCPFLGIDYVAVYSLYVVANIRWAVSSILLRNITIDTLF